MYEDMFKYNVFAMIYSRNLPVNEGRPIPFRNIVEGLYSITLLQFEKKKTITLHSFVCMYHCKEIHKCFKHQPLALLVRDNQGISGCMWFTY